MQVLRDDGIYRHIRFRRNLTLCMYFDLITWPGYLAYAGDMGCYVFSRLPDMFEFFRDGRSKKNSALYVDHEYWAEKVNAADRDGVKKFSKEAFREAIENHFANTVDDEDYDVFRRGKLWTEIESHVLNMADDGEHEARRAAIDFEHDGYKFTDFWEVDCQDYTYRFVWCCYAIAWGIQKYDYSKETKCV